MTTATPTKVLPLDQIRVVSSGRLKEAATGHADVEGLAESIRASGLLQPVGVVPSTDRQTAEPCYQLVYGHRRYAAAKLNAEKHGLPATIEARVLDGDANVDDAQLAENIQRAELNPIEEALAVAKLLDAAGDGHAPEKRCARVAAALGKSVTWVRDRMYLSRLSGKARAAVLEGRLPLAHAREIAKLADPRLRDELAEEAAADREVLADRPMTLETLRREVTGKLLSLAVVPWRMDAAVPGVKAPACDQCPQNSANDPNLFEHNPLPKPEDRALQNDRGAWCKAGEGPFCLNRSCFEQKRAAAEKAIAAGAKAAGKVIEEWENGVQKAVDAAMQAKPGRRALAALILETRSGGELDSWNEKTRDKAARSPVLLALLGRLKEPTLADIAHVEAAAAEDGSMREKWEESYWGDRAKPAVRAAFAKALGITIADPPDRAKLHQAELERLKAEAEAKAEKARKAAVKEQLKGVARDGTIQKPAKRGKRGGGK